MAGSWRHRCCRSRCRQSLRRRFANPEGRSARSVAGGLSLDRGASRSATAARRRGRPLGPTPRYRTIPRWGLVDQISSPALGDDAPALKTAVSASAVRAVLMAATAIFAVAAVAHMLRYVLLLVNRTMLLPPWVAVPGVLMGCIAWRRVSRLSSSRS